MQVHLQKPVSKLFKAIKLEHLSKQWLRQQIHTQFTRIYTRTQQHCSSIEGRKAAEELPDFKYYSKHNKCELNCFTECFYRLKTLGIRAQYEPCANKNTQEKIFKQSSSFKWLNHAQQNTTLLNTLRGLLCCFPLVMVANVS